MTLVRTFLASSGVLSMGPSQDSDRSLSKNIGTAADATGKGAQDIKMSDYYETVVDTDNNVQVLDGGNPVSISDFRNKTGRLTEEVNNTVIDNRNSKIISSYSSPRYINRSTCKQTKGGCATGTSRTTRIFQGYVNRTNTTFRSTTQTTVNTVKDLVPIKQIIRQFLANLFN